MLFGIRRVPLMVCNYSQDAKAWTHIKTVSTPARPYEKEIVVEGKHTVLVSGFVGYVGWQGIKADFFDRRGLRTGFDGYASLIFCKKFL
jgi:hypothetical protein